MVGDGDSHYHYWMHSYWAMGVEVSLSTDACLALREYAMRNADRLVLVGTGRVPEWVSHHPVALASLSSFVVGPTAAV